MSLIKLFAMHMLIHLLICLLLVLCLMCQVVAAEFQNESATALAAAATRHLQEAEQDKGAGNEHW